MVAINNRQWNQSIFIKNPLESAFMNSFFLFVDITLFMAAPIFHRQRIVFTFMFYGFALIKLNKSVNFISFVYNLYTSRCKEFQFNVFVQLNLLQHFRQYTIFSCEYKGGWYTYKYVLWNTNAKENKMGNFFNNFKLFFN